MNLSITLFLIHLDTTQIFWHFLCPMVNFWQVCCVFVSIWTICVVGIDRFFAITRPLGNANKCLSLKCCQVQRRKLKLLSVMTIWLCGIGAGSVQFIYTRVVSFPYGYRTLYDCRENLPEKYAKLYTVFLFVATFGLPLFILVYVYSVIGYRVWRHVAPGNAHQSRDHNNSLTRDKVSSSCFAALLPHPFWQGPQCLIIMFHQ